MEPELGQKFIEIPPFDLQKAYIDSAYNIPIIFILSIGNDPKQELITLAEKMSCKQNLHILSLGQG